jgi:hypothetical protein
MKARLTMLRTLSIAAMGIGALALLGSVILLFNAHDSRQGWMLLPTILALNSLFGSVLVLLLGATGYATDQARDHALAARQQIERLPQILEKHAAEARTAEEMRALRTRLLEGHAPAVVERAIAYITTARRNGYNMSEAKALAEAAAALKHVGGGTMPVGRRQG